MANDNANPVAASAFDSHHPPALDVMEKCVHCGFCLATCPTYVLWGEEMDSPRGRIYLMKMASEGKAQITEQWVGHFDSCLGCVACMPACPSGVDYGWLIEETRAQIARLHHRSTLETLHRKLLFETFTKPHRLNLLRWPLFLYQKTGLQALFRASGLARILPKAVGSMDALMPSMTSVETIPAVTPALGAQRKRVGLLLGCVQRAFLSQVSAATARVLAAEGCEVVAPQEQACCGALFVHAGEEAQAQALARKLIDVLEHANVDVIITNAAGCGSSLKEYGRLLRDDPAYAPRAKAFAAKVKDVTEFLWEFSPRTERKPVRARVALHDSCHLQHAQGVRAQPRSLLKQIPGLELLEIPESPICCGSAGIYNLVQPDAADALGNRKARLIAPLKADVVVTGNPGCIFQLQSSLHRNAQRTPVLHTIQLIDASIRGKDLHSLLSNR